MSGFMLLSFALGHFTSFDGIIRPLNLSIYKTNVCMYGFMCVCMGSCVYVWVHVCMYGFMCVCMGSRVYICMPQLIVGFVDQLTPP